MKKLSQEESIVLVEDRNVEDIIKDSGIES